MNYDLAVIGGGAGGLVVASVAGQLGLQVLLVERAAALGGDCLHSGCVPSKALIHAAARAFRARSAGDLGLTVSGRADWPRVREWVQAAVAALQVHDDAERFRSYGVDVRLGTPARFLDAHTLQVGEARLRARRIVVATGSRPRLPDLPGLAEAEVLSNETVFSMERLPGRLLVLGGGPIGVELAQACNRLGVRVTLVTRSGRLLPRDDADLAAQLAGHLAAEGVRLLTAPRWLALERAGAERVLVYEDENGEVRRLAADAVLVATGRAPNVEGLGLEAAGVAYGPEGIRVDARQRTRRRHIYAVGDVCGPFPFTHMAEHQAGVVIANALFRIPKRVDYRVVPWVTYSDPELAQVGPTLAAARREDDRAQALDFPVAAIDRAVTEGETTGRVRLVVRGKRVLGASILAPRAGELIHEIALGIRKGVTVGDLAATIHAYPTYAQGLRRAANQYYAPRLFASRVRRLVRLLARLPG